jgi:hypothetical protein
MQQVLALPPLVAGNPQVPARGCPEKKGVRMDLWVDDRRPPLKGFTWARTSKQAIAILKTGEVRLASLDHDLGEKDTGYKVICWMEEHDAWPPDGVRVHSQNPVGRKRMEVVIERHYGRVIP